MSKFLIKGEGGEKAELRRRIEVIYHNIQYMYNQSLTIILQVRKYFNRADKNGDGKLTKEEWHQVRAFIIKVST